MLWKPQDEGLSQENLQNERGWRVFLKCKNVSDIFPFSNGIKFLILIKRVRDRMMENILFHGEIFSDFFGMRIFSGKIIHIIFFCTGILSVPIDQRDAGSNFL